ncbi:MAG TPA: NAD(P)H-binding protein [Nitrososphaerales archaeon]|nr:NAD(P)H-binding protein [Nitrososphaerales archaeon]
MKLSIFGGTGLTGRILVEKALSAGDTVTILARDAKKAGEMGVGFNVVSGDALDLEAVSKAIPPGTGAVLVALGHARDSGPKMETLAIGNIITAMNSSGAKRLIVLANSAVRDSQDRPTGSQRLILLLLKRFRRDIYEDTLGVERLAVQSELDWTLVRTSILTNGTPKRVYRVGPMSKETGIRMPRSNMADFMLKCAREGIHVRQCPYVSG